MPSSFYTQVIYALGITQSEEERGERWLWQAIYFDFIDWVYEGGLTEAEFSALMLIEYDLSSEQAAVLLSDDEGKTVTPTAYRRRVATARKKMRRGFPIF